MDEKPTRVPESKEIPQGTLARPVWKTTTPVFWGRLEILRAGRWRPRSNGHQVVVVVLVMVIVMIGIGRDDRWKGVWSVEELLRLVYRWWSGG